MRAYNSKDSRNNQLFLRNEFIKSGEYQFPLIKNQEIDLNSVSLISYSNIKKKENETNKDKGVHFFVDDYRFEGIYNNPERSLEKLKQYRFVLTPDFSIYSEMDKWRMIENIGKNRWIGAYWQKEGLNVIPTISWGTPSTYSFCFEGVEKGAIVAISTLGCKKAKKNFLMGYHEMKKRIKPKAIICFDRPFEEIEDEVIFIDYSFSRKETK